MILMLRALKKTLSQIKSRGGEGVVVQADGAKYDKVEKMAGFIFENLGTVDIMVNNAGTCRTIPFLETGEEI